MFIEVESSPNCEQSLFMRFKEVAPPREVLKIRVYDRQSDGEWCWVTGWQDNDQSPTGPAFGQQVEDSGAGLAVIIYGGMFGIRLKPVDLDEDWNVHSTNQWGEPYLCLADLKDIQFADQASLS